MFIPILSVVTAIFATLTILLRRKGKSFEGMLCKFISSFGFMSMAFIGFCYRIEEADKLVHPFYFCLVAFGLYRRRTSSLLSGSSLLFYDSPDDRVSGW